MPKIVDREARREELAQAVWRVIAKNGMSAVTVRSVADEANWSRGVLAHYFPDKESLLSFAGQLAAEQFDQDLVEATKGLRGVDAIRAMLEVALPLDRDKRVGNAIWINFLTRALENRVLRRDELRKYARGRHILAGIISEMGELPEDMDVEMEADMLTAFVDGLSIGGLVNPRRYNRTRLGAMIEAQLEGFLRRAGHRE